MSGTRRITVGAITQSKARGKALIKELSAMNEMPSVTKKKNDKPAKKK